MPPTRQRLNFFGDIMRPETEILLLCTLKLYLKKNTNQFSGAENIAEADEICKEIDYVVKCMTNSLW